MKSLTHIFFILVFTLTNSIWSSEDDKSFQEQSLLAVLYAQTSAEFSANNIQTYNNAKLALDRALVDTSWTAALEQDGSYQDKMPAIILDVDETVLDNSAFQARTIIEGDDTFEGISMANGPRFLKTDRDKDTRQHRDSRIPQLILCTYASSQEELLPT